MPLQTGNSNSPAALTAVVGLNQSTGKNSLKVPGTLVFLTIDDEPVGSALTLYALPETHDFEEGYRDIQDAVGGTNKPCMAVGVFAGQITAALIYTTDMPQTWSTIVNGDLVTKQIGFYFMNNDAVKTKFTVPECRIYKHGGKHQKDNVYRRTITIHYPAAGSWGTWT